MMHQPIDSGDGHHVIGKNRIPLAEGLIGGDQQTFAFIPMGNQFKEDRGFRLGFLDIAQVIDNEQS